jgi:hypothetical protein
MFPEAIVLGMPSDEFWNGKTSLFYSYLEAFKRKSERKEEAKSSLLDWQSWLTGYYVYQAVGVVMQNSFSKRSTANYPKQPISFTNKQKDEEAKVKDEEAEIQRQYMAFKRLTDTMNSGLKKR